MTADSGVLRTIEELAVLYDLEPEAHDIFVEGATDQRVIDHFLRRTGIEGVTVYEIASVEIPFHVFKDLGLPDNNRSRILVLANRLNESSSLDLSKRVACIADRDFDALLDLAHEEPLLLFTDFVALELYAFDEVVLKKFCALGLGAPHVEPASILRSIEKPLRQLFLIRFARHELQIPVAMLQLSKQCEIRGRQVLFDLATYIERLLNKVGRRDATAALKEIVERLASNAPRDPRFAIHGHDFVELLRIFLEKTIRPRRGYDDDLFYGALLSSVEAADLSQHELFKELMNRFGSSARGAAA